MPDTIPNLWPDDISVTVLTPLVILKAQAGSISSMTKGILEAEVETEEIPDIENPSDTTTSIHFTLVAPAIDRARYRLLTINYRNGMVYPLKLESDYVNTMGMQMTMIRSLHDVQGQQEFLASVQTILRSPQTKSLIQSLIARSNEQSVNKLTDPVEAN